MRNFTVARLSALAMALALAVVLSYVEGFVPFFVPGVKLGFANLIVLLLLYGISWYDALLVDLLRVFLVSLLRGNIFQMGFFMSLGGAIASFVAMLLAQRLLKKLSICGVSVLGAYVHSLVQLLVGVPFLGTWAVFSYFPFISLLSIATGLLIGILADRILRSGALKRIKASTPPQAEGPK
ncbi:MAG: Gx transporter family protein [Bacilli bacterium]|jgi:heptaprenyl diphosphate synthase|nr:Gx transporter family protein [Bacilli bacterium]